MKSMSKEKFKQASLSILALVLILVGYFNYGYKNNTIEVSARDNEQTLGDVELVSSEPENIEYESDIVPNEDLYEETSNNETNYFQETKIERDKMYSEMIENY